MHENARMTVLYVKWQVILIYYKISDKAILGGKFLITQV